MAGKLLTLCFLLVVITLATCKPRLNPFAKYFRNDMDFENDKRGVGWTCEDDCLTYANCPEGFDGHNRVNFHTEGSCGQPWLVCCYRMELSEPFK